LTFEELNLHDDVLQGLHAMNFNNATPVQELAIPPILEGRDVIACAQTGTGKTAAYLLPILDKIVSRKSKSHTIDTIIVVPTRELALQIDQQLEGFAYFLPVSSMAIYGGGDSATWTMQKKGIQKGVDILVSTPGRLIQHMQLGYMNLSDVQHLVLDEADRMLDMGFHDDIMQIIKGIPKRHQTLFFSATMPPKIRKLAERILVDPETINIAISKPAEGIRQLSYFVFDEQKVPLLEKVLKEGDYDTTIIFTATKKAVDVLEGALKKLKFNVKGIHSGLEQKDRETVLREFKNKQLDVLIATDIMSRGIDVEEISLVVNYDVPHDAEDYIHRIGRTARAATKGTAITLVNPKDQQRFFRIEQLMNREVDKLPVPEEFGEAPQIQQSRKGGGGGRRRSGGKSKGRGGKGGRSSGQGNHKPKSQPKG
jgi:ATP-dependent RNA helicase RhlE